MRLARTLENWKRRGPIPIYYLLLSALEIEFLFWKKCQPLIIFFRYQVLFLGGIILFPFLAELTELNQETELYTDPPAPGVSI